MSATLAEHDYGERAGRRDRLLHIGILVCAAHDPSPQARNHSSPDKPMTHQKILWAARLIEQELLDVWRSFRDPPR